MTDKWMVDVATSSLDALKAGVLIETMSRIVLSRQDFPSPIDAECAAAQIAIARHGGTATWASHCI